MEPQIRYCTTSDGVRIAFTDTGAGFPLVTVTQLWSHVARGNSDELDRATQAGARIIRYDGRGMGSSDRRSEDFSLDARVRDLEAVVDHLALARFILLGTMHFGQVAIAYAARHPDRVWRLVLTQPFADGERTYASVLLFGGLAAMRTMADTKWDDYTMFVATSDTPFADAQRRARVAKVYRDSMTPRTLRAIIEATRVTSVVSLLPMISMPTLVLRDASASFPTDLVIDVAAAIPRARLVEFGGSAGPDFFTVIAEFLGAQPAPQVTERAARSAMTAILFADIADSTALTERMGDAAFRERARALDHALRRVVRDNGGAAIDGKLLGDGILATFPAASQAIVAALAYEGAAADVGLGLHVGLHAGDVIREDNNVFGGAVNIASRISGLAAPGEVLVSDIVRGLARTSAGVVFEDRGEHALKGVGEPQRVFAVRKDGA